MQVSVVILLTNRCNKHCPYCFMANGRDNLSYALLSKALESLCGRPDPESTDANYSIVFMGGEPLLNFKVLKKSVALLRKMIPQARLRCRVVTNGSLLRQRQKLKWFRENPDVQVAVSTDDVKMLEGIDIPQLSAKVILTSENVCTLADRIIEIAKRGIFVECTLADGVEWTAKSRAPLRMFFKKVLDFFCHNVALPPPDILSTAVWAVHERREGCRPGVTSFCVDAHGTLHSCERETPDFNRKSFKLIHDIQSPPELFPRKCASCRLRNLCSICPAVKASIRTRDQAVIKCLYVHEAIAASVSYLSNLAIRVSSGALKRRECHFLASRPKLSIALLAKGCYDTGNILIDERMPR